MIHDQKMLHPYEGDIVKKAIAILSSRCLEAFLSFENDTMTNTQSKLDIDMTAMTCRVYFRFDQDLRGDPILDKCDPFSVLAMFRRDLLLRDVKE